MARLLVCLLAALGIGLTAAPASADQLRVTLSNVRVDQQREASGDRPYFVSVQFRSRICRRGTSSATLIEREPHDWVSKPALNGGRPGGHHMQAGQSLPIPAWQGDFVWDGVTMVPLLLPSGALNGAAASAEVLGLLIVSFDNNNTPPHVIRNNMNRVRELTRQLLIEQVESCRVIGGINREQIESSMGRLAGQLWSGWDIVDLLGQMTIGSTFNPDQPTGINLIMLPAISGYSEDRPAPVEYRLPAGPVAFQQWIAPAATRSGTLNWTGSGARYSTPFRMQLTAAAPPPPTAIASDLRLRIRTGGDDLRGGNDNLMGSVRIAGRWTPEVMLNVGAVRWADNTTRDAVIPLPPGTRLSDLQAVRLRTTFRGGFGGDNWNMDGVRIDWRLAGAGWDFLAERAGAPARRFTAEQGELIIELR